MVPRNADKAVVDGFLAGEKPAFDRVQAYIEAALGGWRRRFGVLSAESDDIKSDVLYKLLMSLQRGDFEYRSGLATFVSTVVNRTCVDYKRYGERFSDKDAEELNLPSSLPSEEEKLEKRQAALLNFRVLRQMSRKCIELWHMRLKDCLTCGEIGRRLDRPESTIRGQLRECREEAKGIREILLKKDKLFGSGPASSMERKKR